MSLRLISIQQIKSVQRPPGYAAEVLAVAVKVTDSLAWLTERDFARLARKHSPASPAPVSQPRHRWPQEARIFAAAAIPADTGLGDVYARKIAGDDAERWRELAGRLARGCGCAGNRVGWLNARFPLDY